MKLAALNIVSSIKETPKATDNTTIKDNGNSSSGKTNESKDFREFFTKATKEKSNNSMKSASSEERVNRNKEDLIRNEDGSYEKVETEEVQESNSNENSNKILSWLQGMLNGEISFTTEELEGLSGELSTELIAAIKNALGEEVFQSLDLEKLQTLNNNLKNDILQLLQNNDIQNKSLGDILSELGESALKELDESQILQGLSTKEDGNLDNLQENIINILKEKLLNQNPEKNLQEVKGDLKGLYNSDVNLKVNPSNSQGTDSGTSDYLKDGSDEDKFLKDLASGSKKEGSPKFDKVMNFMNSFNKVDASTAPVQNVEKMVVNKNNFLNDMIKSVKFMELNDMKEMTVKIMPRELGEVVIKLTMQNGLMKANITAQNKEAYSILNSNLQELNDKLGGEIKIQNFTIDIYNGDTTFFSNEKNRQQNGQSANKGKNSNISGVEEIQNTDSTKVIEDSNVNAFV